VLLGDADTRVAEQDRDLIDGNTGQEHLHCEGIAEHAVVMRFGVPSGLRRSVMRGASGTTGVRFWPDRA